MEHRREFIKLLIASFISQSGSHFLTIALAGFVFIRSGSVVAASLIFVLSYLPSIFVGAWIGDWIDRNLSRWVLACNELVSIIVSISCGLCISLKAPLPVLCMLIALRSLLLFTARTGGIKWIKLITSPALQASRVKFFFLSFFLSTATAGIMAALALRTPSILVVVLVDVGTYLLSFGAILLLRELESNAGTRAIVEKKVGTIATIKDILGQTELAPCFIAVCISQAVFQGAYSVLVSYLPINLFQLGVRGLGAFQVAASLGIITGFLILWLIPGIFAKNKENQPVAMLITLSVGVLTVLACANVQKLHLSLFFFFVMNTAYECIWLYNSSEFFRKSNPAIIGRYQFVLTASASCTMAIFTLCYAGLIEIFDLRTGIATSLLGGILIWGLIAFSYSRKQTSTTEELSHE